MDTISDVSAFRREVRAATKEGNGAMGEIRIKNVTVDSSNGMAKRLHTIVVYEYRSPSSFGRTMQSRRLSHLEHSKPFVHA